MTSSPPRAAPLCLAPVLLVLLVCGAHALAWRSPARSVPASPWAAVELFVPGLFAPGANAGWPFAASAAPGAPRAPATPAAQALAGVALAPFVPATADSTRVSPYVGWVTLWLALIGLLPARTRGRRLEAARVTLLALALGAGLLWHQSLVVVAALVLAAAVGLQRIRNAAQPADAAGPADLRPQLAAASACVVFTAALIAASLHAGFSTDAEALAPLLSRLEPAARGAFDVSRLALEADHLRAVLDRAALAAFLGMTVLLLHLKSRARWSAALCLVVTAADLASLAR